MANRPNSPRNVGKIELTAVVILIDFFQSRLLAKLQFKHLRDDEVIVK